MFRDGVARLLVFRLGAERFALTLSAVDEAIELPALQRVPDSPAAILGVASLRGSLVTVYDPRALLNISAALDGAALVFRHDGRCVALAVDDVYDAITVEEHEVRPAPGVGSGDGILIGVIRRDEELIAVLDVTALLDAAIAVSEGEPR